MNHLTTNMFIMNALSDYLSAHPEIRFQQALQNMNIVKRNGTEIVDSFYEDPAQTLREIRTC